jgi:hypothetical protein
LENAELPSNNEARGQPADAKKMRDQGLFERFEEGLWT